MTITEGVRTLTLASKTVSSATQSTPAEKPQPAVNLLQDVSGRLFKPLADALPMMSLDLIRLVAQYTIDDLVIAVDGDLEQLSGPEKAALAAAAQDIKFLDFGDRALTTKNGLQLQETFPNLETIRERGKQWSWAEWKNSIHRVDDNELDMPPAAAWDFASIVRAMFQTCQGFEADVKQALVTSPFYSWYATAPADAPLLESLRGAGIHPLQHRLACLLLAKLLLSFKIEEDCVFFGKTKPIRLSEIVLEGF